MTSSTIISGKATNGTLSATASVTPTPSSSSSSALLVSRQQQQQQQQAQRGRSSSLPRLSSDSTLTNTTAAQTTVLGTIAIPAGTTWTLLNVPTTFVAPSAGIYYFGFNDNSAPTTTAQNMRLDTITFTSVLGTNEFLSSKFSVFPNPVNNVINFSNDQNAVVSTVDLTDLNGRVIKSLKVNATEGQISVSDLATGMYMMKITTDQGIAVKKIVKQ